MTVVEHAPAKINLGLKILGKRPDGFHDILSIFQTVSLTDELTLSDDRPPGFFTKGVDVPSGRDNIVVKADRVFREAIGYAAPVRIELEKKIPVGAGLGGGSSDAAAALRGLARLAGYGSGSGALIEGCAAKLGSDVPFLLHGGTAVVSGRGERVEPVAWQFDFTYAVVFPGFGVSTAGAYGRVRRFTPGGGTYGGMIGRLRAGSAGKDEVLSALGNDFEEVVFPEHPVLFEMKNTLLERGADSAFLTGSGSALVGVFGDEAGAEHCAAMFRERGFFACVVKKTS